jgi:DNA-binding XRE family transcriptional regulator
MQTVSDIDIALTGSNLEGVKPGKSSKKQVAWPKKQSELYTEVGALLRALRLDKKKTQEALAHMVGMKRTSLTNIEKGRQKLLLHTIIDLAEALEVSPTELLPSAQLKAKLKTDAHG